MSLIILLLILATLVSFVDTTPVVLPGSPLPDSNCCVKVAEILPEFHRQPDPRSNQHVMVANPCNRHPYESPTPLAKAEITPTYLLQHVDSAPKITTWREYCSGLLDERIKKHAQVSPAYCNKAFTKFKGVWRSNNCVYYAPNTSDQQRSGWKKKGKGFCIVLCVCLPRRTCIITLPSSKRYQRNQLLFYHCHHLSKRILPTIWW